MTHFDIPFKERMLKFNSAAWHRNIARLSPTKLVPVLWEGTPGRGFATFDSVAIIERLHELFPVRDIWPRDALKRARARSLVAEFHAGFSGLRSSMPMNIRSSYPGMGMDSLVAAEVSSLCDRWEQTHREFGGSGAFLFGEYCAADAFFTPVASRLRTYGVELNDYVKDYQENLLSTSAMRIWTSAALRETEFVPEDEPYATSISGSTT